jgi:hypothetical protein
MTKRTLRARLVDDGIFREKFVAALITATYGGYPLTDRRAAWLDDEGDTISSDPAERAIGRFSADEAQVGDAFAFDLGWRSGLALGLALGENPGVDHQDDVRRILGEARTELRRIREGAISDIQTIIARDSAEPNFSTSDD